VHYYENSPHGSDSCEVSVIATVLMMNEDYQRLSELICWSANF